MSSIRRTLANRMLNASSAVVVPGTIMAASIARIRSNIIFTVCSGETVPGTISAGTPP